MSKVYDNILKENLVELSAKLIAILAGLEFVSAEPLPTELRKTLDYQPDFLYRITDATGKKAILHVEYQRVMKKEMTKRMMLYHSLLHDIYSDTPVYQHVIYWGEENKH